MNANQIINALKRAKIAEDKKNKSLGKHLSHDYPSFVNVRQYTKGHKLIKDENNKPVTKQIKSHDYTYKDFKNNYSVQPKQLFLKNGSLIDTAKAVKFLKHVLDLYGVKSAKDLSEVFNAIKSSKDNNAPNAPDNQNSNIPDFNG